MTPEITTNNHEVETDFRLDIVSGRQEIVESVRNMFAGQTSAIQGLLFAGDRISCCDEAIALKRGNQVIGMATIAPKGEDLSGTPTVVGIFVQPEYRQKGFGTMIFQKTLERCFERGFSKIRIDVLSKQVMKMINKLPPEIKEKLAVYDLSKIIVLSNF